MDFTEQLKDGLRRWSKPIATGALGIVGVSTLALLAAGSLAPLYGAGFTVAAVGELLGNLGANALASWLDTWARSALGRAIHDGPDGERNLLEELAKELQEQLNKGTVIAADVAILVEHSSAISTVLESLQDRIEDQQHFLQLLLEDIQHNAVRGEQLQNLIIDALLSQGQTLESLKQQGENILSEVRRIRASIPDNKSQEAIKQKAVDAYLHEIIRRFDRLEPFGLPHIDQTARLQRLSSVYITLDVATNSDYGTKKTQTRSGHIVALLERRASDITEQTDVPVSQVLSRSRRLLITGEAGSGKSTLSQWLAVRTAVGDLPQELMWVGAVPFFIRLRECAFRGFPAPESFPTLAAPITGNRLPKNWVTEQLESGNAVVLLDGLDELPRDQREALLDHVAQLVASYPLARYIITSRPVALSEWTEWQEWIQASGFLVATIRRMGLSQITDFVYRWHAALEEVLPPEEHEELVGLGPGLIHLLRERPLLLQLASSPLLCAMVCTLHRERRENLPAERLQLYEEVVQMLLAKRDEARRLARDPLHPNLSYRQKLALIRSFAAWFMGNGYSEVRLSSADDFFEQQISAINPHDLISGESIRINFVERTGLLHQPSEDTVGFIHKTFQEYLASGQIVSEGNIDVLLQKADDDRWRELIILAAGQARPQEREKLLRGLIGWNPLVRMLELTPGERSRWHRRRVLALSCLETCVQLSPGLRQHVIDSARSLFPPTTSEEARIVAAAGNIAVPLLTWNEKHPIQYAAYCVEALALIGSSAALEAISTYSSERHDRKCDLEIGRSWDSFNRKEYAVRVLSKSKSLTLPEFTSWEDIDELVNLKSLEIRDNRNLCDIIPLQSLINLEDLIIGSSDTWFNIKDYRPCDVDISPLSYLQKLKYLFIRDDRIRDIKPLKDLSNLVRLELYSEQITDIEPLSIMTKLTILRLERMKFVDLEPISHLRDLWQLTVFLHGDIPDISPIAHLKKLVRLTFYGYSGTIDLSPLQYLHNLTHLSISAKSATGAVDLSPISQLYKLTHLNLANSDISDLDPLKGLANLRELNIEQQIFDQQTAQPRVRDLTPLASLSNLESLRIHATMKLDTRPLRHLKKLKITTETGLG